MLNFGRSGLRRRYTKSLVTLCLCALAFTAASSATRLAAQESATPTLHVYANLVQVPTLVLSPTRGRIAPVAPSRFWISIDSGPIFKATHVRPEGDDPISLSILLDVRGSEAKLLPNLDEAIANLAPTFLHPKDHVSIYVLDCSLFLYATDIPAESGPLKHAVTSALTAWTGRLQEKRGPDCRLPLQLWDALAYLSSKLYGLAGRRVILAMTDGSDTGSTHTWNELTKFAQATGVAIFGLSDGASLSEQLLDRKQRSENFFNSVCELSGGMVFFSGETHVAKTLKRFTAMLRERYIVEFPRPLNGTAGPHRLQVTIEGSQNFIRSTGISFPPADPALLADPNTIPQDPSRAPVQGSRRILADPH